VVRALVPLVLLMIFVAECAWFIRTQSLTYDEPIDIAAGLDGWRHHRFELFNDHTPLARLLFALPLLNPKWQIEVVPSAEVGWRIPRVAPDPELLAGRARAMNVALGILLGWLLWATARRMFSLGAANLALALFVFSPTVIANFSVATTDGAVTLMIFAVAVQLSRWREDASIRRTLLLGVLMGLMLLAKFSAPVMFVLALFWILVLREGGVQTNPLRWNWGKVAGVALVAAFIVWAGYFFHVSKLTLHDHRLTVTFPNRADLVYNHVKSGLNLSLYVPAGEYFEGFRTVVRHNSHGMQAFFWGRPSRAGGWKLYYPAVMLLKWPIVTLTLFMVSAALLVFGTITRPRGWIILFSFPAVYTGFAIFSHFDLGDRHILPVYIFVLLIAGSVWQAVASRTTARVLLSAVVLLQAADTLRYAPDYLAYFNTFVKRDHGYTLLSGSNFDWGQGLLAVRNYERVHPTETISLSYFGSVEPQVYGIRARQLGENESASGIVIMGATNLSGEYLRDPSAYHWVLKDRQIGVLDHCMLVFDVAPEERVGESPDRR
jgi:MFS family permease